MTETRKAQKAQLRRLKKAARVQPQIPNPEKDEKGRWNAPQTYAVFKAIKTGSFGLEDLKASELGQHLYNCGYFKLENGLLSLNAEAQAEHLYDIWSRIY